MRAYLEHDPDVFRDRTILLPCDGPGSSFVEFFDAVFEAAGIARLVATGYRPGGRGTIVERDRAGRREGLLAGDGDFRSREVTALRDEADLVITNPPFSLFREFIAWLVDGGVGFSVLGNQTAISSRTVFPLIRDGRMWLGPSITSGDREFQVPDDYPLTAARCRVAADGSRFVRVTGVRWFTTIDHGRRHAPLPLPTAAEHRRYSRHAEVREHGYRKYDNLDAIEVPFVDAIPADHAGLMGVPITFLDKHCPDQFELVGLFTSGRCAVEVGAVKAWNGREMWNGPIVAGRARYARLLIRHRHPATGTALDLDARAAAAPAAGAPLEPHRAAGGEGRL